MTLIPFYTISLMTLVVPLATAGRHTKLPKEPRRIEVNAINASAIMVSWRPVEKVDGYMVYYRQLSNAGRSRSPTECSKTVAGTDAEQSLLLDLHPGRYAVTVAAYFRDIVGRRSKENEVTIGSSVTVPPLPRIRSVNFKQPCPPIIHISWFEPEKVGVDITGYLLMWGTKDGVVQRIDTEPWRTGFSTPVLEWNTTYVFSVLARNVKGYSEEARAEMDTPVAGNQTCSVPTEDSDARSTRNTTDAVTFTNSSRVYLCSDIGVAGRSCAELEEEFKMSRSKLCRRYYHECCSTCVSHRCRKDKRARTQSGILECPELIEKYGAAIVCTVFTAECCKTCRAFTTEPDYIY